MKACFNRKLTRGTKFCRTWCLATLFLLVLSFQAQAQLIAAPGWSMESSGELAAKYRLALSVTPSRRLIVPAAGQASFTVANMGSGTMTYKASESSSWMHISRGAQGGNRSSIIVSCLANTGDGARAGAITIRASGAAGSPKTVKVIQGGRTIPLLFAAPNIRRVGPAAGRTTFTVANKGGGTLRYTTSESVSWLKITRGASGIQGKLTVAYTRNSSSRARTGTVVVAASGANGSPTRVKIVQQPVRWTVLNKSYPDTCAEHDNINVVFRGNVSRYSIVATHPRNYSPTDYSCAANFENCVLDSDINYYFDNAQTWHIDYTAGSLGGWMNAYRDSAFWRPSGFKLAQNGTWIAGATNIHRIDVGRQIETGSHSYPGYFALYADGYSRLIPFPPIGQSSVCFGSSVIIGPATPSNRPFADIKSVDFRSTNQTLLVKYRKGGSALVDFSRVTRDRATILVTVAYATGESFCTFRSMYVTNGNSDCDSAIWINNAGRAFRYPVMSFPSMAGTSGVNWLFNRRVPSIQRMSAPDIRIVY